MNKLPEWANWVARDRDGSLYMYEKKPYKYKCKYFCSLKNVWCIEGYGKVASVREPNESWFKFIKWEDEEPTPLPPRKANVGGVRMNDLVNHPSHYKGVMGLETRDVQKNFVPKYEKYGVMVMCDIKDSIKYITRAPDKNDVEDINKAIRMLQYAKEGMERSINETF